MVFVGSENSDPPRLGWKDLWGHGRLAVGRVWAVSPPLLTGLVLVEMLASLFPVLFAVGAGLVLREAQRVFQGESAQEGTLLIVVIGLVALMLVNTLGTIARTYLTSRLTDELRLHLSVDLLEHLSKLDLSFFENTASQDMAERAGLQPGRNLVEFLVATLAILTRGLQTVSLAALLLYIEPLVTPLLVMASVPLLIFRWRMARLTYAAQREQTTSRRWAGYYARALSSRAFLPTVKLYGLAPILIGKYSDYLRGIKELNRRLHLKRALGGAAASTLVTLTALGLLVWVGSRTTSGDTSVQMIGTLIVGLTRIQGSIQGFVDAISKSFEKVLFVSNLGELFEQKASIHGGAQRPERMRGSVELRDVHFRYPGSERDVLEGVTMTLEAGKTTALIGPNGCGKTTLTRLLARLSDVDRGSITIDGHDIRELSLEYLYKQIAYVGQNAVRFEATVAENIAYGDWERLAQDSEALRRIGEQAQIGEMIEKLEDGYDTRLGRRFGTFDLSVGQWQKLAVARALAKNALILILDEPTASMDVRSEHDLYRGFQNLASGKTTLLISHRFSTVAMADHIYVMDEGRIVDHGTHEELLQRGGMYASMFELHRRLSSFAGSKVDT